MPTRRALISRVPQGHWKTITFVAGLRHDKLTAPLVVEFFFGFDIRVEPENVSVGRGVSLLRGRSGGVEHPHDTPPYLLMPSPTFAYSFNLAPIARSLESDGSRGHSHPQQIPVQTHGRDDDMQQPFLFTKTFRSRWHFQALCHFSEKSRAPRSSTPIDRMESAA
jgi:hypothetical protein